jgi:hypothetical protein
MAWKCRAGKRFYYRCRRIDGRVVTEYWGGGLAGALIAEADQIEQAQIRAQRAREAAVRDHLGAADSILDRFTYRLGVLQRAVLVAKGYHRVTRRDMWRRRQKHDR